jgi:hypothetical protein
LPDSFIIRTITGTATTPFTIADKKDHGSGQF